MKCSKVFLFGKLLAIEDTRLILKSLFYLKHHYIMIRNLRQHFSSVNFPNHLRHLYYEFIAKNQAQWLTEKGS